MKTMLYKENNNEFFNLRMIIEIIENIKQVNILVILDNKINKKREMVANPARDFADALTRYNMWNNFLFAEV